MTTNVSKEKSCYQWYGLIIEMKRRVKVEKNGLRIFGLKFSMAFTVYKKRNFNLISYFSSLTFPRNINFIK